MKVSIIGSGVYGKAIAKLILTGGADATIWTEVEDTKQVLIPEGAKITHSYEEAVKDARIVFILTSSKFVKDILNNIKPFLTNEQIIVLGSKGILDDGTLLSSLTRSILPNNPLAVISGPTFAVDIAALETVGFTIGTSDIEVYNTIKSVLNKACTEYSSCLEAVEMSGSLKNAYAIGSGILSGSNKGTSTMCLYITKALNEIKTIFKDLNLDEETCLTLAGVGDLFLTCSSPNSRNFSFGMILSLENDKEKEEYLKNNTVEGYENLLAYVQLFKKKGISAPILETVYKIVKSEYSADKLEKLLLS